MNTILLTEHIPSDNNLERLNLFAGRHMGEDEFERQQAYVDRRLAPLLGAMHPGIVHGLEVRPSRDNVGFTVSAGLAVAGNGQTLGLYYPLRETWPTLIENQLKKNPKATPEGVFYLTLERNTRYVDANPDTHPEQRTEFDPTRDARRLIVGSLGLKQLPVDPTVAATLTREQVENWIAANHVDGHFLHSMNHAVPLGLVFIREFQGINGPFYTVIWFSPASGQYRAIAHGGYQVLLQQTREAFRRLINAAAGQNALTVPAYLNANLKLDFLPAAGELPLALVRNIASRDPANPPGIAWLPAHIAVDMVPVPEESVPALLNQHLPRRVVDLRQPTGERLRLLVAVNEPDYKPDLLDVPLTDKTLHHDIYRYFMRAYDVWAEWKRQFDYLYYLTPDAKIYLTPAAIEALALPDRIDFPRFPGVFFNQVIEQSRVEVGVISNTKLHYPYDQGVPAEPAFFVSWKKYWTDRANPKTPNNDDPRTFPQHENEKLPTGLVVQYTAARLDLESLDTQIRALRSRIEKTRDYLLLQRQQLDSQTVSLAALAGGVAGDGSGLQVARWLPFTKLTASEVKIKPATPAPAPAPTPSSPNFNPYTLYTAITPNLMMYKSAGSVASTAQQILAKAAEPKALSNINNLVFSSTLRKNPTVFSALQFNMNNIRLDRIAEAPKQALTKPAFEAKEFRFGVIEHVRPEIQEYKKATRGMGELISTIRGIFGKSEGDSLDAQLKGYGTPKNYEQIEIEIKNELKAQFKAETPSLSDVALNEKVREYLKSNSEITGPKVYEALFNAGKILTKQIAWMESRYEQLEAKLQGLLRVRINKEDEIEKLMALIRAGSERLAIIDKRRIEFLGDYGVAQRLLDDDWLDVFKLDQERTRVLTTAVRGLYYLRVCQAPVGQPLADPLLLRHGKASDIVPGCDSDIDPDLPDDLDDFFETVLEIPMGDWLSLRDFKVHIPASEKLEYIESLRRLRLQTKTTRQAVATNALANGRSGAGAKAIMANTNIIPAARQTSTPSVNISLFGIRLQTQANLYQMAQLVLPVTQAATRARQEEAARVLSLADLMAGTKGPLQKQAQTLHNRLEQAAWCMLEKLNELPPSVRLEWAQLAEDDRLNVERVALWPGLERAERDDFNATRTLAEIVAWWFKQLDTDYSATTRSAMRNMVRAVLIHAAMGDPAEILHGNVQVPPRRALPGELLRLQLNRAPKPGTTLQLLDTDQRVVAFLNVDDHDEKGTIARITHLTQTDVQVTTRFRVVASKATAQLPSRR